MYSRAVTGRKREPILSPPFKTTGDSEMKRESLLAVVILATATFFAQPALTADIQHSSAPPIPDLSPSDATGTVGEGVPAFKVLAGYHVDAASSQLPECRFLQFDNFGTLYISAPKHGTITSFKLHPKKITGLHNMEFVDGWLWYTSSHGVYKGKVVEDGSKLDDMTTILPE